MSLIALSVELLHWGFCNCIFISKMILSLSFCSCISQLMFYLSFFLYTSNLNYWLEVDFLIPKDLLKDIWFRLGILYFFYSEFGFVFSFGFFFFKSLYQLKYFIYMLLLFYIHFIRWYFWTCWNLHYSLPPIILTMWLCVLLFVLLDLCFWKEDGEIQM